MKEGIHIQIIRIEDKDYPLQLLKIKNPATINKNNIIIKIKYFLIISPFFILYSKILIVYFTVNFT